jgi:hypothetical protein
MYTVTCSVGREQRKRWGPVRRPDGNASGWSPGRPGGLKRQTIFFRNVEIRNPTLEMNCQTQIGRVRSASPEGLTRVHQRVAKRKVRDFSYRVTSK